MRNLYLTLCAVFTVALAANAQPPYAQDNLGLDSWFEIIPMSGFFFPDGFVTQFGTENTTDPYSGTSSVTLTTSVFQMTDTLADLLVNGKLNTSNFSVAQGEPWSAGQPTSMDFYTRYNTMSDDTCVATVLWTEMGSVVGGGYLEIAGTQANWTMASVPVTFNVGANPDSIFIVFQTSTDQFSPSPSQTPGTTFEIDAISFPGSTSGIEENQVAAISVFPNPATDVITVEAEGAESIVVTNIAGRKVMSTAANGAQTTIDVSDLSNGAYIVRVIGTHGELIGTHMVSVK